MRRRAIRGRRIRHWPILQRAIQGLSDAKAPDAGPSGQVADATGNWVDRLAPRRVRPYLRLSRADRPIGTWLLLLPCWWGALLAAGAVGYSWTVLWVITGSSAGAWLMRGAGCTWNDITDRRIDAMVARTRSRPLPSGQVGCGVPRSGWWCRRCWRSASC